MISRRKILSRPRDEALYGHNSHYVVGHNLADDEEDVWYSKDKLLKVSLQIFDVLPTPSLSGINN